MSKCDHDNITRYRGKRFCADCEAPMEPGPTEWHMLCCQELGTLYNTFIAGPVADWVLKHKPLDAVVLNSWPVTREAYEMHKGACGE